MNEVLEGAVPIPAFGSAVARDCVFLPLPETFGTNLDHAIRIRGQSSFSIGPRAT